MQPRIPYNKYSPHALQALLPVLPDKAAVGLAQLGIAASANAIASNVSAAAPATLVVIGRVFVLPNTTHDYIVHEDHQLLIQPGFAVQVNSTVANQTLGVSMHWRERPLEESEQQ